MTNDIDIFAIAPVVANTYFKFEKVGDQVQGTYIGREDNVQSQYGLQTLVKLLKKDGETILVSIKNTKEGLIKLLDEVSFGQIIGFKFVSEKENKGRNASKIIHISQDKSVVDKAWLAEREAMLKGIGMTPAATTASVAAPVTDSATDITKEIIILAKEKLGATDESSVKTLVMEKTGLAFINVNLEIILERLKAL